MCSRTATWPASLAISLRPRRPTLARDAGVRALILTHLSRRYAEREVLQEAQAIFPDAYVARDFDQFQIAKGGEVQLIRPGQV